MADLTEDELNAAEMATFLTGDAPETPEKPAQEAPEAAEDEEEGDETEEQDTSEDESDDQDAETGENDEESEQKPRRRTGAARYRQQRERAEAAEARAAALEARLAALERGEKPEALTPDAKNETQSEIGAPDPAKYQYGDLDPQYISDLADFKAEQKVAKLRQELLATEQQKAAQREAEVIRDRALQTAQVGSERYADFNEVVIEGAEEGEWPLTEPMLQAALDSDKGADILYYLATNVEEAEEVAAMSIRQLDRWIGRMEAKLATPPAKKVSKAPPPVSSARGSGGKYTADPATSDFAAFERLANQKA